jgi:hypothetical protein
MKQAYLNLLNYTYQNNIEVHAVNGRGHLIDVINGVLLTFVIDEETDKLHVFFKFSKNEVWITANGNELKINGNSYPIQEGMHITINETNLNIVSEDIIFHKAKEYFSEFIKIKSNPKGCNTSNATFDISEVFVLKNGNNLSLN